MDLDLVNRIKEEREKRGLKQVDIANSLNIDRSNYTRLENRGIKLTFEQINSIADAIGISIEELLGFEKNKIKNQEKVFDTEKDKEIEELKKRVAELEDRVNDKTKINLVLQHELEKEQTLLIELLYEFTEYVANKLNLEINLTLNEREKWLDLIPLYTFFDNVKYYFETYGRENTNPKYFDNQFPHIKIEGLKEVIQYCFKEHKSFTYFLCYECLHRIEDNIFKITWKEAFQNQINNKINS